MEENLNSFIDNQERAKRITTNCSDPASSSQQESPSSPHEKLRSPNTMMLPQETNKNSLQDAKFQPLDLWDEGSIYRCKQRGWVSLCFDLWLLSVSSCFHLEVESLLLITSRIHWGKCHWGRFWKLPLSVHLAEWHCHLSFPAQRTLVVHLGVLIRT